MKIENLFGKGCKGEKVKFGKVSTESEILFGNRGGNLKQGEMHHCLKGMFCTCSDAR